jgi:lipid II:glycine glycyltransferase (peptidoglycan interpeptide bridge formation enzyme)
MTTTYTFDPVSKDEFFANLGSLKHTTFYNSPERIAFLESRKREVKFFAIKNDKKVVGYIGYQKVPARSGEFLYFQHAPLLKDEKIASEKEFWKALYDFAHDVGVKEKAVYVRFTPRIAKTEVITDIIDELKYLKAPVQDVDASVTRIIDITNYKESQLLDSHKEKLKKAQSEELVVSFAQDMSALESFILLYKSAMAKSAVIQIPMDYMKSELELYIKADKLLVSLVHDQKGTVYAASTTVLDGDIAWFYWSAATEKGQNTGADVLMMNNLVKELKKRNIAKLDLWGEVLSRELIEKKTSHPWSESDKFKSGFGSELVEFITAIDIPINNALYRASGLYQRFTLQRRGYPMTSL